MPQALHLPLARPLAGLLALTLFAWAGVAALLARAHMAAEGVICGAAVPHCGWCYAAAALGLAGLSALALAVRPRPRVALASVREGRRASTPQQASHDV